MKSFQSFISEEKKRPVRVTNNPSGQTITNLPGGNIPDEQKFSQLEKLAKQKSSKSVAAADDVSPQMRTQAADTSARAKNTGPAQRRPLGDTTKGGEVKTYKLGQSGQPSKEAAKTLRRMMTADPVTTKRLQSNLSRSDAAKQAAARRARLSAAADKVLRDIKFDAKRTSPGARRTLARMSAAVDKTRAADRALADKANEILKQTRADAKTASTTAPKPAPTSKPRVVRGANTLPKGQVLPKPAPATQASAPKQFAPGSSGTVSTSKNVLNVIDTKPSRPKVAPRTSSEVLKLQRAVNRGIRQRAASGLLKGAGVAAAGLEARGEYLSRLDKGQSQATALKGSASRVGGGWLGAQTGAGLGAKIGSVLGPKGAAAGGLIGGVAGYMGGAELGTRVYDAARKFKFSDFQKKVDKFRKLDASKYRTFGSNK